LTKPSITALGNSNHQAFDGVADVRLLEQNALEESRARRTHWADEVFDVRLLF